MSDDFTRDLTSGLEAVGLNVLTEEDIAKDLKAGKGLADQLSPKALKGSGDGVGPEELGPDEVTEQGGTPTEDDNMKAAVDTMDEQIAAFKKRMSKPPKGIPKDHINKKGELSSKSSDVAVNIPIVNVKHKVGDRVGVVGAMKGTMCMANAQYKVTKVKPNGNITLKRMRLLTKGGSS